MLANMTASSIAGNVANQKLIEPEIHDPDINVKLPPIPKLNLGEQKVRYSFDFYDWVLNKLLIKQLTKADYNN